ncbi:MAG TPA: hypothetical protein VI942_09775 [Thermoanaerobaculia bacterium]|nr:hypothetical protein [Thermoanaerobaculia bacterium]
MERIPTLLAVVALTLSALPSAADPSSSGANKLRADMRKLWEDHVTWTRVYIISAVADLEDQKAAAGRLLENQVDIGDAIKPIYGDAAGTKLTALLEDHIKIATEVIAAAKAGDAVKKEDAGNRWYHNADDVATFLSGANPEYWPASEMKKMMRDHLDLTTAEVVARIQKNWSADVAAYDKVHDAILMMADMLSEGIIRQHPDKF